MKEVWEQVVNFSVTAAKFLIFVCLFFCLILCLSQCTLQVRSTQVVLQNLFFFFHFKGEVLFLLVLCKQAKECFLFKWVIICSLYCVKHDNSLLGWEAITSGGSNAQNLECCSRATFSHWLNIPSQYRILNINLI